MVTKKTSRSSRRRTILVIVTLIVVHLLLAPHTTRWQHQVQTAVHRKWVSYQIERFTKELNRSTVPCRDDLLPCMQAFKEHLATRHIKLRVLLRPSREDLVGTDGKLLTSPTPEALALTTAERTLKKAGIRTVNLLPDIYKEAALHPEWSVTAADRSHLSAEVISVMAQTLCDSLEERQKSQAGRHILLVGDCYALLTAVELKKGAILPGISSQWKNSGDAVMAFEVSRIPAQMIPHVREIYWVLSSHSIMHGSGLALPFPSPLDPSAPPEERIRTVLAHVTKLTRIPADLWDNPPYPNALALHQITTENGETLLAAVPILEDRRRLPSSYWTDQQRLQLTLQPWEAATRATPSLGREQVLDDLQDFTTARYYVTGWLHPQ